MQRGSLRNVAVAGLSRRPEFGSRPETITDRNQLCQTEDGCQRRLSKTKTHLMIIIEKSTCCECCSTALLKWQRSRPPQNGLHLRSACSCYTLPDLEWIGVRALAVLRAVGQALRQRVRRTPALTAATRQHTSWAAENMPHDPQAPAKDMRLCCKTNNGTTKCWRSFYRAGLKAFNMADIDGAAVGSLGPPAGNAEQNRSLLVVAHSLLGGLPRSLPRFDCSGEMIDGAVAVRSAKPVREQYDLLDALASPCTR